MADMTVREAGRKGGEAVRDKYGSEHYAQIGKKGGQQVKKRGKAYYSEIGKIGGSKTKARRWLSEEG